MLIRASESGWQPRSWQLPGERPLENVLVFWFKFSESPAGIQNDTVCFLPSPAPQTFSTNRIYPKPQLPSKPVCFGIHARKHTGIQFLQNPFCALASILLDYCQDLALKYSAPDNTHVSTHAHTHTTSLHFVSLRWTTRRIYSITSNQKHKKQDKTQHCYRQSHSSRHNFDKLPLRYLLPGVWYFLTLKSGITIYLKKHISAPSSTTSWPSPVSSCPDTSTSRIFLSAGLSSSHTSVCTSAFLNR